MNLKEWLADRAATLPPSRENGDARRLGDDCRATQLHLTSLTKGESKPIVTDNGPKIDNRHSPKPILRDTRGIRVRTMAGKLSRHGERTTLSNAVRTQADGTTQVIVYDPSRDYVDMHGAFVALRDIDVKALPPKLRRAYERAKHRASVANNVKPE